ncbi:hypothetical protein HDU87_007530 [Geranomyces variabilis]|uniref:Uncharacterized protein n=1 Tax=Geranomyces variabilis TaxID=109894 RepID=A0AAD5XPW8_9FUNG|nr:hypothetical protein HDU87_007530 [Geranomyces variabilis]
MVLVTGWPLRNIHYHGLPLSELRTVADPTTSTRSPLAPGTDPAYPLLYPRAAANRARSLQLEERVIRQLDGDFPGLTSAQRGAVLAVVAENDRVRAECMGMEAPSVCDEEDGDVVEFPVIMRELKEAPEVPSTSSRGAGTQSVTQKYSQFLNHTEPQILRQPAQVPDSNSSTFSSSAANSALLPTAATAAPAAPPAQQSTGPTNEMRRVLTSLGQWVHATLDVPTLFLPDSVAPPPIPATEFDALLAATNPSMLTPAAIVVAAPERRQIVLEDNPPDVLRRMEPPPPEPVSAAGRRSARRQRAAAAAAPIGPAPILAADGKMDAKLKRDAARDAARLPPAKAGRRAGNWAQGYGKWYVRPTLWNAFMQKSEAERARHTQQANTPTQHHRQISTLIHVKLNEIAAQRIKEEQALLAYAAQGAIPATASSLPGTAATPAGGALFGTHPSNSRRSSSTSISGEGNDSPAPA